MEEAYEENEILENEGEENIINNTIKEVIQKPSLISKENIQTFLEELKEKGNEENYSSLTSTNITNLIKFYIESNLDETGDRNFIYYEVFKRLKMPYYMRREYLIPIYEYFSEILHTLKKQGKQFKTLDSNFFKFYNIP